MGETDVHIQEIIDLRQSLKEFYRAQPDVHVASNLLLYYEEGNPRAFVVPDVFVVVGLADHPRRIYKLWEEGQPPTVVWEITSRGTRRDDVVKKRELYARLGVQEYYLFDPLGEYLRPRFQGFVLREERYEPLPLDEEGALWSAALGIRQYVEGDKLRLVDAETGEPLLRPSELAAARREAEERARAEAEARRVEVKARRAAEERASLYEAELARVRAELAALRGEEPSDADE
jgi:Uma2 family endonuclease